MDASALALADLERYDAWRRQSSKKMKNGRRVDQEVITLKHALRWAHRLGKLKNNPLEGVEIGRFQVGNSRPSRECRPRDADHLHELARRQFEGPAKGHVLGSQMLFEAFTGVRTGEALACRWDAKWGEAGFVEGECLVGPRKGLTHGPSFTRSWRSF
jgi:hypothetical protein